MKPRNRIPKQPKSKAYTLVRTDTPNFTVSGKDTIGLNRNIDPARSNKGPSTVLKKDPDPLPKLKRSHTASTSGLSSLG